MSSTRNVLMTAAAAALVLSLGHSGLVQVGTPALAANEHANEHATDNANGNSGAALANAGPADTPGAGPSSNAPGINGNTPNNGGSPNKGGGINAQIAALHGANANLQAFIHASPKSEVGKIATYAKAECTVQADQQIVATDTATFEALPAFTSFLTTYGLPSTTTFQDLEALADTLPAGAELTALQALLNTAQAQALMTAINNLAIAEGTATVALTDAANKTPVDNAVKLYVDAKLNEGGIMAYYCK